MMSSQKLCLSERDVLELFELGTKLDPDDE